MKVSVKIPATIANLGCGFDSFGLALPLYNIISVEETVLPGSGIEINIINEKNNEETNLNDVPTDKNNIVSEESSDSDTNNSTTVVKDISYINNEVQ